MSNKFFLKIIVACALLGFTMHVLTKPSKLDIVQKSNLTFKTKHFEFSGEILKQSLILFKNNPGTWALGAAGLLGSICYTDEIAHAFKSYRDKILAGGCLSLFFAYIFKNKLIEYLPEEDDVSLLQNFEKDNEVEQNTYSFSKSDARIFFPGDIKTTFEDVAGLETAKEDLLDIIMYLKDPTKFMHMGAKIPKGILLTGSPGNGKTLIARALAGEVQCCFLYVSASEFIEAIVGLGAARVRNLFSVAKELAPCVIFIDEIDAIGRKRTSGGSGGDAEFVQTLNQLLSEMDGFEQHTNPIVVIGATNRADILDHALIRPGRFDRKVEIYSPFIKDRCQILKVHLRFVKTADDIDVYKIARGTPGFSGAELAQLVNEAAILAVREQSEYVSMLHIDKARDYMTLGRETRGREVDAEEYWETAVHEAGHALARVYQKDAIPLYKVSITPRGGANGITYGMMARESYRRLEQEYRAEIIVTLAGSVAEELMYGGRGYGASNDLKQARYLATQMVMECGMTEEFKDISFAEYIENQVHLPNEIATKLHKAVANIIHGCRHEAEQLLLEHKDILEKLTNMLLDQGTVFGSNVYALCGIKEPNLEFSLV